MRRWCMLALTATLSGCPLTDEGPETSGDAGPSAPGDVQPHPCLAHRTDALRVTGRTVYVGCGTGGDGRGLWRSTDAGRTWAAVEGFEAWRVNDVHPAPDGGLYVAGIDTESRTTVIHRHPDGGLSPIYTRTDQVDGSFHVGHFARTDAGEAIAESLTGAALVHRDSDSADWRATDRWASDGAAYQLLALISDGERFYGAGSTITQPPTVFLPAREGDALFTPVAPLPPAVEGELWHLAEDGGRLLAVGVDQGADRGLVLVGRTDAYAAADWASPPVADAVAGNSWFRGACLRGDHLVVVGERQPIRRGGGLAFESTDAGATWAPVAGLPQASAWHRCALTADGHLVIAGADGAFAWQ